MAKSKFEYMSTHEWLGDPTTHFMKSGETLRSPLNADVESMAGLIPRQANGVKVEYDISFDMPGKEIHGYKVTDLLTKCINITPQSSKFARENTAAVAGWGSTDEGREIFQKLARNVSDKYLQTNDEHLGAELNFKDLIVLPGTNIMIKDDFVDFEKIDELVRLGAIVKLHPITSKVWQTMLKNRWGDSCVAADAPLYMFLRAAERIHFTMSSETGIAAVLLAKKIGLVSGKKSVNQNFESLYRGFDTCAEKITIAEKLTALLSHPESGLISVYHKDPEQCIQAYFDHMGRNFEHKKS